MPDPYIPPASARSYDVPADLDAVDVATWFEDFADTVDGHFDDVDTAIALKLAVAPSRNVKTADADFALTDATGGGIVVADKATAIAFTMLQNSAMASSWPTDSVVRFINKNDGELTVAPGAGVTFIGDVLTFGKGQGGVLVWDSANTWVVVPFASGSEIVWATVASTTGSPTTGQFTGTDDVLYDYWLFPGAGSMTFATDGRVKVLVAAGGGGSGSRGGGAAGGYIATDLEVIAGAAYPVTVGPGGTGAADTATNGGDSRFGPVEALGGGSGGGTIRAGTNGGSGGGAGQGGSYGKGLALNSYGPQGFDGGNDTTGGDGGGGAAGPGGSPSGAGGPGREWINGTTYCTGGATSPYTAVSANTGDGARVYNQNGASGVVIVAIPA